MADSNSARSARRERKLNLARSCKKGGTVTLVVPRPGRQSQGCGRFFEMATLTHCAGISSMSSYLVVGSDQAGSLSDAGKQVAQLE